MHSLHCLYVREHCYKTWTHMRNSTVIGRKQCWPSVHALSHLVLALMGCKAMEQDRGIHRELRPDNLQHTHTFNVPFPWLPRWAGTRKVKPIWILMKQETVSGSGIRWAICKSARRSRQITMSAPLHNQQHQSTEGNLQTDYGIYC